MSDVFVSYKAEDRRRVQPLVEALEADGLTVWWDAHIGGGDAWRETIQEHLDAARCVIVIWSKRSIGPEGRFVRDEAGRAQRRGVYLPIRIDAVEPPLGFGETQALPLRNWRGDRSDARYRAVHRAVHAIIAGETHDGVIPLAHEHGVDRRLVIGGGTAAVAAAGIGGWFLFKPSSAAAAGSIAVLPFANLSSDPNQAYFSDGLAEELRSALSRAGLEVVGRTSSEAVKNADAETASRKLGVANILTGSVRRSPSTIRVNATLIKGSDGLQRWSQEYDRKPGDELTIQSDIAQNVAEALSVTLGKAAKAALTLGGTSNAAAQDLYLKANAVLRTDDSEAGYRQAIGLLDSATTLDPKFANAFALKSLALNFMTGSTTGAGSFDSGYAQAAMFARQAIALAPTLAAGHTALATVYQFQLNLPGALEEYRKAAAFPDITVLALLQEVIFLTRMGAFSTALEISRRAEKKDPLNNVAFGREGYVLAYWRRYSEAIAPLQKATQLAPTVSRNHTALGFCWAQLGKVAQAEAEYRKAPADDIYRLTGEAVLFDRQGNRAASNEAVQRAQKVFGEAASYQYAEIYAQRGDKEGAFAALDRAWAIHDPGLTTLRVDPYLDPLRGDPRLKAMEKRLNFPAV